MRKKDSKETKLKVVLAALAEERPVTQIAQEKNLSSLAAQQNSSDSDHLAA